MASGYVYVVGTQQIREIKVGRVIPVNDFDSDLKSACDVISKISILYYCRVIRLICCFSCC